jgi:tRNA-dihydrouridine synthase B
MKTAEETGFRLGPHRLVSKVLLAPMSGVTDVVLRGQAARLGAGLVVSEMVASDAFVKGDEESRLRAEGAGILPHAVQLAGCEPHWMAEAARLAEANGADIIDINMGCPAKRVTGGWAGSALMRDLDHAVALIEAVIGAVAVPVTVKMRLGWDDASRNAPELARRAQASGAAMVTVHGRTRQQFYKGVADWTAIAAVKQAVTIPVVANGDILTVADARACLAQSGADGVMIGRAAMGRIWLPGAIGHALSAGLADITTPPAVMRAELAIAHYQGLLSAMGAESGLRHARKHLSAYADDAVTIGATINHTAESLTLKAAILTSTDPNFVTSALMQLFVEGAAFAIAEQAAA